MFHWHRSETPKPLQNVKRIFQIAEFYFRNYYFKINYVSLELSPDRHCWWSAARSIAGNRRHCGTIHSISQCTPNPFILASFFSTTIIPRILFFASIVIHHFCESKCSVGQTTSCFSFPSQTPCKIEIPRQRLRKMTGIDNLMHRIHLFFQSWKSIPRYYQFGICKTFLGRCCTAIPILRCIQVLKLLTKISLFTGHFERRRHRFRWFWY